MFGKYELRYIADPKNALGKAERVEVLARKDIEKDNPEVSGLLSRMKLPIADLEAAMFNAQQTSYEKAVDQYIADHPDQIKAWLAKDGG
jgi:glycine betaine/proline transport system substrate-binding protein